MVILSHWSGSMPAEGVVLVLWRSLDKFCCEGLKSKNGWNSNVSFPLWINNVVRLKKHRHHIHGIQFAIIVQQKHLSLFQHASTLDCKDMFVFFIFKCHEIIMAFRISQSNWPRCRKYHLGTAAVNRGADYWWNLVPSPSWSLVTS